MRPDTFPIGSIFTHGDIPELDWDNMRLLACKVEPEKTIIGLVTINYNGHSYKTANRDGRLRFKRVT